MNTTAPKKSRQLFSAVYLSTSIAIFGLAIYGGITENPVIADVIKGFIVCYLILAMTRQLVLFLGTLLYRFRESKKRSDQSWAPFVSVIVPAFNEGKVIGVALKNILNLNYENYEVLLIDDGSSDNTAIVASQVASFNPRINCRIITQINGGKASALNRGISHAAGELIMCVDADSHLSRNCLWKGVRHFENKRVGAVSGFIRVGSVHNLLLKFQDLEYAITLNFTRPTLSLSGAVTIVPGPSGMFRREALLSVNGYSTEKDLFAEDADLSIRLLAKGWRIVNEEKMTSVTEAPEDLATLLRQRYRWNRGILQAIEKNILKLPRAQGLRGLLIAGYLVLDTYVIRIINAALTVYFMTKFIQSGDTVLLTQMFIVLVAIDAVVVLFASQGVVSYMKNVLVMFVSRFSYAYVLLIWGVICLFEEGFSSNMSWDKLERTNQLDFGKL